MWPFFLQFEGKAHKGFGFTPHHPVGGCNEGKGVEALGEAEVQILVLLTFLVHCRYLVQVGPYLGLDV